MAKNKPIDVWLGIGSIVMTILLFLLGKTPVLVVILSVAIFALLIHPVWSFWWVENTRVRQILFSVLLAAGCFFIAYLAWPTNEQGSTPIVQPRLSLSLGERLLPITTYLQSLPWWWIAISLATGLLIAAWPLISLLRAERKRAVSDIKELQKDAFAQASRVSAYESDVQRLKTKYEWLDAIVEYQRNGLPKYAVVEQCEINTSSFSQDKRYLEFVFHVRNYSMFYVSIPMEAYDSVKGAIKFKGDPLSGQAKIVENKVTKLPPYSRNYFKVWQWVNPEEAKDIPHILKTVGNLFDFSAAVVYIKVDSFPDDEAAKLDLTLGMQNADLENKIIKIENANARLRTEITAWKEWAGIVRELNHSALKVQRFEQD